MGEWKRLLEEGKRAARQAGERLRQDGERLRTIEFIDKRDVKLEADRESEIMIRDMLGSATGLPVVGEEQGGDDSLVERDELYWIVDPLDGTYNYLRGCPLCAVSIGLMRGETPVLGIIYDFNRDEMYEGIVGEGAYFNGIPMDSQWAPDIDQAVLSTGFPAAMDLSGDSLARFVEQVQTFKKVRMVGSAAMALAYVAVGYYDVYHEAGTRLWDIAGGLAIIKAAGGEYRIQRSATGKFLCYDVWTSGKKEFLPEGFPSGTHRG